MFSHLDLTFAHFQSRLLDQGRRRVQNGEFTERGLARLAGLSQPHLHNLLKGVRVLTTSSADSLLAALDIGVLDLANTGELGLAMDSLRAAEGGHRAAPVLKGRVGPGWPIPDHRQALGWRTLPPGIPNCGRRPAIALLAADPVLRAAFPDAAEAVIDFDEMARLKPRETGWYLLRYRGAGLIRQIRLAGSELEILGQMALDGGNPESLPLGGSSVLHVVRGRLVWAGRQLPWAMPNTPAGA